MNITCKHCGRQHSLFWLQGVTTKELYYTCHHCPAQLTNKVSGRPEVRSVRKRLIYHESVSAKGGADIPIRLTRAMAKKEADAHQEKTANIVRSSWKP